MAVARAPHRLAAPVRTGARPAPRHAPQPQPARRPDLRVVREPAGRQGRAKVIGLVATGLVFAGLFALAIVHTLLVQHQLQLDTLQHQVDDARQEYQKLRLQVAVLESPQRIVDTAESRLGMVPSGDVVYLTPSQPQASPRTAASPDGDRAGGGGGPGSTWAAVKPYLEGAP
jgi:cell division protein FtsL